jgi:carotenoid cleavage dioxygenase-like enzyme
LQVLLAIEATRHRSWLRWQTPVITLSELSHLSRCGGRGGGYALAFVHNPDRGATDLVILAAQDFTAEPIARVHLPARIPLGFHGSWIADE